MIIAGRKNARFFGSSSRRLFGVLHEASGEAVRDTGVVLCYPAPQEYRMVHWGFHALAASLAAAGFPVLRFDYFATGDSQGDSHEGTLAGWTDDVSTAAAELQDLAGVRRIALIGKRLGAVIALRAIASGLAVRDVVLWDPVIQGSPYLQQLEVAQRWVLDQQSYPIPNDTPVDELFGYPFSSAMRRDVECVDLMTEALGRPRRLHMVAPFENVLQRDFLARARELGIAADHEIVADPHPYQNGVEPADTLVAHNAARSIALFLTAR